MTFTLERQYRVVNIPGSAQETDPVALLGAKITEELLLTEADKAIEVEFFEDELHDLERVRSAAHAKARAVGTPITTSWDRSTRCLTVWRRDAGRRPTPRRGESWPWKEKATGGV